MYLVTLYAGSVPPQLCLTVSTTVPYPSSQPYMFARVPPLSPPFCRVLTCTSADENNSGLNISLYEDV